MFSLVVVYNFESTYYEGKSMAGFVTYIMAASQQEELNNNYVQVIIHTGSKKLIICSL